MRKLTSGQMAEVALEALANARRLYDDAVSLCESARLPSALMVGGLATDELGKHILVSSFYARDQTDEEWRNFWRRFHKHQAKLGDALLAGWVGDLIDVNPPLNVEQFHQERLKATYVDVSRNGTVSVPSQTVTKRRTREVLALVHRELSYCESVIAQATPSEFAEVLESMRTAEPVSPIRQILNELGSEGAMAFAMYLRAGMSYSQARDLARQANEVHGLSGREQG